MGILSDIWIAFLLTLVLAFIFAGKVFFIAVKIRNTENYLKFSNPKNNIIFECSCVIVVGIVLALHQSYVDFFGFQIVPFHLSYLSDQSFITANITSLFRGKSLVILCFTALFVALIRFTIFKVPKSTSIVIGVLALIAHQRNIHWRVQWFIPEQLQMNFLEQLYTQITRNNTPVKLSSIDWENLSTKLYGYSDQKDQFDKNDPKKLLSFLSAHKGDITRLNPTGEALRNEFRNKHSQNEQPLIIAVLMESLRPSEMGYYAKSRSTLTPFLDQLASQGISFSSAFATGSVTRGGQEAVLCGLPSQRNYSLMRGGILFKHESCLFSIFKNQTDTFWYHGGDPRFDNQLQFWLSTDVHDAISLDNFPSDAPRTSWGIGDVTFLKESAKRIAKLRSESIKKLIFGSVLTISNHIPWDIPGDIPGEILTLPQFQIGFHPSHKSTAYSDYAISIFVDELKKQQLWDKSIVLFLSDHGTALPPFHDLYASKDQPHLWRYAHIPYIISGGITELVLKNNSQLEKKFSHPISQASAARFLADLIAPDTLYEALADHPLALSSKVPIVSAIEDTLFAPQTGKSWPLKIAISTENSQELELLYFKAIIQLFNTAGTN